jgi:hypothetical protein
MSYLNELILKPILDHSLKQHMVALAQKEHEVVNVSFEDIVDKYKLSKLKEDALTQLDDKSLKALSVQTREEVKQLDDLMPTKKPSLMQPDDNSQDMSRHSEDI